MKAHGIAALGLLVVLSGCSGSGDGGSPAPAPGPSSAPPASASATQPPMPTRSLVLWSDLMCSTVAQLTSEQGDLEKLNQDLQDPTFGSMAASSYLGGKSSTIESLTSTFAELPRTGNAAADGLVAQYKKQTAAIAPKVEALAGQSISTYDLPLAEQARRARKVGALIATIKPTGATLVEIVKADPVLSSSYNLAPQCTPLNVPQKTVTPSAPPTTPLPAATDGENYTACGDGNCQVLVKSSADITVLGKLLHVTVKNGVVGVSNRSSDGSGFSVSLSEAGGSSWGKKDSMTSGKVVGLNAAAAVVEFSST